MNIPLFITTIVGFEKELLSELQSHTCVLSTEIGKGGVYADVSSFQDVMYLNYALHTANRVLVEMVSISRPRQRDIYQSLYDINWKGFFRSNETFCIEVPFSTHPDFTNTLFAAQFMKDPICDRLKKETGKRPSIDVQNPTIRFQALVTDERFCFYFDSSTIPLFKRGYRADIHHIAPLKETLAAALLMRAGFDIENDILIDPCAGSGTFLIESLLLQHKIAPGLLRKQFGFLSHPCYDFDQDQAVKQTLKAMTKSEAVLAKSVAIEKEAAMYRNILHCLTRVGIIDKAHIINSTFQNVDSKDINSCNSGKAPTFLIANPPYGIRMACSQAQLERIYRDLGDFIKQQIAPGGRAAILLPQEANVQKCIGMRPKQRSALSQGGINCNFVVYEVFDKQKEQDLI